MGWSLTRYPSCGDSFITCCQPRTELVEFYKIKTHPASSARTQLTIFFTSSTAPTPNWFARHCSDALPLSSQTSLPSKSYYLPWSQSQQWNFQWCGWYLQLSCMFGPRRPTRSSAAWWRSGLSSRPGSTCSEGGKSS